MHYIITPACPVREEVNLLLMSYTYHAKYRALLFRDMVVHYLNENMPGLDVEVYVYTPPIKSHADLEKSYYSLFIIAPDKDLCDRISHLLENDEALNCWNAPSLKALKKQPNKMAVLGEWHHYVIENLEGYLALRRLKLGN